MTFDPLVPVPVMALMVVVAVGAAVVWMRRGTPSRGGVLRWTAMGVLLLIAAADPAIGGGRAAVKRSDANVLFVVDTTGSMAAEDYDGDEPRLVGVRHDVMALADEFPGAHYALVTFNSKTRVIVPWTTDRGALDSAARLLRQEWTQYAQGTRLDEPLPTMRQLLPRCRSRRWLRRRVLPHRRGADGATGATVVRAPRPRRGRRGGARLRDRRGRPHARLRRP